MVEEAVERLSKFTNRDEEFLARFGSWSRPSFAQRYKLQEMVNRLVNYDEAGEIIDVAPFLRRLAPEDRRIAGEIARFCGEEFEGKFATDKTLNLFRLNLVRRLDACGF